MTSNKKKRVFTLNNSDLKLNVLSIYQELSGINYFSNTNIYMKGKEQQHKIKINNRAISQLYFIYIEY